MGEVLDDRLQLLSPAPTIGRESLGNQLEVQIVAVAPAIQADAKHDGHVQCSRDLPRSRREFRRRPEELDDGRHIARAAPITEHGDQRAFA